MRGFWFTLKIYMSQVITLDDLTDYMPETLDSGRAQIVVDAMNTWVQVRTNRCFGESLTVTERYNWSKTLWLRHQDVTGITSVKLGYPGQPQTTVASTGYFFNSFGRVTLLWQRSISYNQSAYFNDYIEVTYTYGLVAVPDDLKAAVLGVAAGFYNWATSNNRDVAGVSVGSYQIEYTNKKPFPPGMMPDLATSTADANWSIIESYRQRRQ